MPSSFYHQISTVLLAINRARVGRDASGFGDVASILDIGCGWGKYGALCREYVDLYEHRVRIDAVEPFADNVTSLHETAYDTVFSKDVRELLPDLGHYDLGLFIDILEHFEHEEGEVLLKSLLERIDALIVSTPKQFIEQGAHKGNHLEEHLCVWTAEELEGVAHAVVFPDPKAHIAYLDTNKARADAVRERSKKHRENIARSLAVSV